MPVLGKNDQAKNIYPLLLPVKLSEFAECDGTSSKNGGKNN